MTERPCEFFHKDLVGPARVYFAGGKWYVLVIVDDYSRYAWVFLANRGETFDFVRDLILRLKMRGMEMFYELFVATIVVNLKTLVLKPFVMIWVSNIRFLLPMWLVRMLWLRGKTFPL
jgi:hypothetical protein